MVMVRGRLVGLFLEDNKSRQDFNLFVGNLTMGMPASSHYVDIRNIIGQMGRARIFRWLEKIRA